MESTSKHVVVIGAGIVGAICAVEAVRNGLNVTVLDPSEPGDEQAASYGNSCWLSSHSVIPPATPGLWRQVPRYLSDPLGPLAIRWSYAAKAAPWLARYMLSGATWGRVERTATTLRSLLRGAPALHRQYARDAGVGDLIHETGLLHVFPARADFEREAPLWAIRRRHGIEWTELDAGELHRREPFIDPRYTFGVFVQEAGHCGNPGRYTAALIDHACASGASLIATRATGFTIDSAGRLQAVLTESGPVACDAAVIATGARSKALAAAVGDRMPLETERGYHVSVENFGSGPLGSMMVSDHKMVVTSTELGVRAAGQVEIAGLDAPPNWERAKILERNLLSMFPMAERSAIRPKFWMGHRPGLPDGIPCIGHARASRDIVHAFGHGHIGLVSAARTGRLVGQLLLGREPEIALAPFRPDRF